jgi:hypothetical protein
MFIAMNKGLNKSNKSERQTRLEDEIKVWKYDKYYLLASLFIISGLYFYLFGNNIFFYQENLTLFVFSCDYLKQFTSKPGGLLEYAGNFLSQGYFNNIYGTFILSVIFTSIAIIFLKINKKLSPDRSFSLLFAALVSCFLILMQTNINYLMHNNLGFLLTGLYFLFSISSDKKISRILVLAFFPLFFYITGAYAWIYLGMYIFYYVLKKKVIYPICLLIIAGLSLLLFKEIIFLQPWSELLYYPMPLKGYFNNPVILWLLFLLFVFYPVFINLTRLINIRENYIRTISTFSVLFTLLLTIFLLSKIYNQDVADLFKLEKMFFARDWNGVIKQQETYQSKNPVAQYYYNTALSESGMLCDRLFFAPQDYGTRSISIPWNSQINMNKMFRGVYFYYSIGLINEAHRWAFESMVIQGYRPENIKLLIKTDLINGHYKVAEKYITVLKKTLHYRNWVKKYEAMLENPELINSDPELGGKIKLKPQDDFIVRIRNPQKNITSLLQSNPGNKRAFEYKIAWLMLEKNIEGILNEIRRLTEMNYSKIPRHIEEAALLLKANIGPLPELNRLSISNETESRFSKYMSSTMYFDRAKSPGGSGVQKELRNTFWYYLDSK